jgi:uncharacterized protein YoxC
MRDDWDNEDWAGVEDMDDTTTTKGLQSVVVVEETLTEEEVSGDAAAGFKDTVAQLTKTLESFKSSFDDTLKELQCLNHKIDEERKQNTDLKDAVTQLTETLKSKTCFDDTQQEMKLELTALSQDVKSLNLHMKTLTMIMDEERKQKTLERALILPDLDAFAYHTTDKNSYGDVGMSSELAKGVIRRFMLGQGAKLPSAILNLSYRSQASYPNEWNKKTIKEKDTMVKEFVDEFVKQISTLIGKQPRTVKVGDMVYNIYYE